MERRMPFRRAGRHALVAVVSAALAGEAGASAGRVDFVAGGATATGTDGRQRSLSRGAELDKGDTIRTGGAGRVQIRFPDGAYVSLQPNTEFSIRDYSFAGKADGSEVSFFALARGAMRTVTGLIGRVNRNRYQIATPTATIGIRGTGGVIEIGADGSTLVTGTSGIWTLTNPSGTIDIPAGVSGRAPSAPGQPPQRTTQTPTSGPVPVVPVQFAQADQRAADGSSASIAGDRLVSGPGYAMATAFSSPQPFITQAQVNTGVTATFDAGGRFSAADTTAASGGGTFAPQLLPGGSHAEANNVGGLAWGRWIGPVQVCSTCAPEIYSADSGFHYVIGVPTASMPTTGTGVYSFMGATSPTYADGHTAPGSFSGQLSANFANPAGATVSLNMTVSMPDAFNYTVSGTTAPGSGARFSGSASATVNGLFQVGGLPLSIVPGPGAAPTTCSCSCTANIQGFFSGPAAARAGLSYVITDLQAAQVRILGVAAFQKTSP